MVLKTPHIDSIAKKGMKFTNFYCNNIFCNNFPIQTYRDEIVARVYRRYQELLLTSNAVDFDDLLMWTAQLLESQPAVREKYTRRYEHVLVDEFQDTNMAQYTLLKHLASFHGNIFVVGDADQSIYRWRGADYRNVLRFEADFPAALGAGEWESASCRHHRRLRSLPPMPSDGPPKTSWAGPTTRSTQSLTCGGRC